MNLPRTWREMNILIWAWIPISYSNKEPWIKSGGCFKHSKSKSGLIKVRIDGNSKRNNSRRLGRFICSLTTKQSYTPSFISADSRLKWGLNWIHKISLYGFEKFKLCAWSRYSKLKTPAAICLGLMCHCTRLNGDYRKTTNIRRTLEGNKIVDHSDVVGASPVGAAPTPSLFST